MEIFGQFCKHWPGINKSGFSNATHSKAMASVVNPWEIDVIIFAKIQLEKFQQKDDC